MTKHNILALIPLYGTVPANSVLNLINLISDANEYYNFNYIALLDLYVPWARTQLFTQTIDYINTGEDLDGVFLLDQDHVYNSNDFMNLFNDFVNSDYDVMGGMYRYKDETQRPVAYDFKDGVLTNLEEIKPNTGIHDVDVIGLGFCFMKPAFLEKMYKEFGNSPFFTTFEDDKFTGEDVAFFKKAKEIGAKVGLNTNTYIKHFGACV